MKFPQFSIFLFCIIFHQPLFSQNESILIDSISLPYSVTSFKIKERQKITVLILQATNDSLLITPIRNWQRIQNEPRTLPSILPALLPIYGEREKVYAIPYTDLEELKVITTMRNPNRRPDKVWRGAVWGAGGSAAGSILIGLFTRHVSCLGVEEKCEKPNIVPFVAISTLLGGVVGGLIDYSIDMKMNISTVNIIKKRNNKEWEKAMREFSILR